MLSNVMSVPSSKILVGDCKEQMAKMPDNSVDSIVTDPPYHLQSIVKRFGGKTARNTPAMNTTAGGVFARKAAGFMGKTWDGGDVAYNVEVWQEALRILKPGGHLLSFGGSRTYHRMACAIEDAGFEIRDQIMWVYGSGFPKSLNVGKAIDKVTGAEREVVGVSEGKGYSSIQEKNIEQDNRPYIDGLPYLKADRTLTKGNSQWEGWGTALKPAHEPIVVARKPLDGTVANNVLAHGTGAMNIDGCRVTNNGEQFGKLPNWGGGKQLNKAGLSFAEQDHDHNDGANAEAVAKLKALGRFPANFIHDGSDEVLELFPNTGKSTGGRIGKKAMGTVTNVPAGQYEAGDPGYGDNGSAARFFYCAKANKKERNAGLTSEPVRESDRTKDDGAGGDNPRNRSNTPKQNHHPTVKPVALMRYLVRLVTPPNGIVFDPFLGSGTTAVAAILEGFEWSGCEITPEYLPIIEGRVAWATEEAAQPEMELFQ